MDHPQGHRFQRRAGQAAGHVGEDRPAGAQVDAQPGQRINHRQAVGAPAFRRLGKGHDVGHVGRQLDVNRLALGPSYYFAGQALQHRRVGPHGQATVLDVGAGDVQFNCVDRRRRGKLLDDRFIFRSGEAGRTGNHRQTRVVLVQPGQLFLDNRGDANILQAVGIEPAGTGFTDPGLGIPRPGVEGG